MSIRITFPNGVVVETDTLAEALAVAKTVTPGVLDTIHPAEPAQKRTRVMVTNGDLQTLDTWGVEDEDIRKGMSPTDWGHLAADLGRTLSGAQSVVRRYAQGAYERNGSDPNAYAKYHADRDRSRPAVP